MKSMKWIVAALSASLITAVWIGIFPDLFLLNPERPPKRQPLKIPGSLGSLQFLTAARSYPADDIPPDAWYRAYVRERKSRPSESILADEQPWEAIGPHNIGGRTLALALNPAEPRSMYAGSASGGLWRSYSGGRGAAAWEHVPTGFPVQAVAAIAIAPKDTSTIYIGTGEVYAGANTSRGLVVRTTRGMYGIGVLKSTDGGISWRKSLDWSFQSQRGVSALAIDPTDDDKVWAGTSEGLFRTTDAGATWNQVHTAVLVSDIAIDPTSPETVFFAAGNFFSSQHGIYRSSDGGSSWRKLANGLPSSFGGKAMISLYPGAPATMYASIGNGSSSAPGTWLCRSMDGGDSWTTVSTTDYAAWQGWYSHDVIVHSANPELILAAGINLWKSALGGEDLQQKTDWRIIFLNRATAPGDPAGPPNYCHADYHALVAHPTEPNTVFVANDGGIFVTSDFGESFENLNGGYQTAQFYNGFSSSDSDSLFALGGLQDNFIVSYVGELGWKRLLRGDGCWTAIGADGSTIFGSTQNLNLFRSPNRGADWFPISIPPGGRTNFVAPFVQAFDDPDILYGGRAVIYKSSNGGLSWQPTNNGEELDGNGPISMAISRQTSEIVYVGTASESFLNGARPGVFRTIDGGVSWENIGNGLPDRFPMDLAVNPRDDLTVYVVFGGFATPHVYRSIDAGETWSDISGNLPDVPTLAVAVDPDRPEFVYVGNELGVYLSADGGQVWIPIKDGMPEAAIAMDISISPQNRMLRVATHGNGVYQRPLFESAPTDVPMRPDVPASLTIELSPQPVVDEMICKIALAEAGMVEVSVIALDGRRVATLLSDDYLNAGSQELRWNLLNPRGERIAGGKYAVIVWVNGRFQCKPFVVMP